MDCMTRKRKGHDTKSKALAISILSSRQTTFLAWSCFAEACTSLKLSWMKRPLMNAFWLACTSRSNLGASLLAKTLAVILPTEWMRAMGLNSFIDSASVDLGRRTMRASFMECRCLVSSLQNASNADMRSCLITGQAAWKKRAVKLSGPDALFGAISLITLHTLASVNLLPRAVRSREGRSRLQVSDDICTTAGWLGLD
jgi:hypothetical protein